MRFFFSGRPPSNPAQQISGPVFETDHARLPASSHRDGRFPRARKRAYTCLSRKPENGCSTVLAVAWGDRRSARLRFRNPHRLLYPVHRHCELQSGIDAGGTARMQRGHASPCVSGGVENNSEGRVTFPRSGTSAPIAWFGRVLIGPGLPAAIVAPQ